MFIFNFVLTVKTNPDWLSPIRAIATVAVLYDDDPRKPNLHAAAISEEEEVDDFKARGTRFWSVTAAGGHAS